MHSGGKNMSENYYKCRCGGIILDDTGNNPFTDVERLQQQLEVAKKGLRFYEIDSHYDWDLLIDNGDTTPIARNYNKTAVECLKQIEEMSNL